MGERGSEFLGGFRVEHATHAEDVRNDVNVLVEICRAEILREEKRKGFEFKFYDLEEFEIHRISIFSSGEAAPLRLKTEWR